jgi:tetratricopeptide (TPR) repeat protein
MHLRAAPEHAGHLDLLPLVRRIFRHRLPDARLRTVESDLLDVRRHHDVDGWEIPGRYFDVLRGGPAELLADVVTHNAEDVRSLGRLVSHLARCFGDRAAWASAPPGDLAGLGRAFRLSGRLAEALECLDLALSAPPPIRPLLPDVPQAVREAPAESDWWTGPVHFPWREPRRAVIEPIRVGDAWTEQRLLVERAHLLRRLGRHADAELAWVSAAAGPGRISALAWVEVAKLRERRLGDLDGALAAAERARLAAERRRWLGLPEPRLEQAIATRLARLRRRLRSRRGDVTVAAASG